MRMSVIKMNRNEPHVRPFLNKPFFFWGRFLLGAIFILARTHKILLPAAFAQTVYNYQILPDGLINLTAIILPWLEVLLGFLLISGFWVPGAVVMSNLLLVTFFCALVFNMARGLDIQCGCFSTSAEGNSTTTWYLIRDAVLLILAIYLLFKVISHKGS